MLQRLRPVTFNWKVTGEHDLGLIAEEVAEIEPLLITHNKNGEIEGVKYDQLNIVLINAVKQQQQTIAAQQQRGEDQEERLKRQEEIVKNQLQRLAAQQQTLASQQKTLAGQQREIATLKKLFAASCAGLSRRSTSRE